MNPSISIIIVNYNSKKLLLDCLSSIKKHIHINYEVIIIDNNSTDNSLKDAQEFICDSKFKFIESTSNLGFAKANNMAFNYANAPILHFLNPDTIVGEELNYDYFQIVANPDYIYVTPLINKDNSIENSKNCMPTIKNSLYRLFYPSKVEYWYIGASVVISRINFIKIGRWSEDYFMYSEDIDLFYKINKLGLRIVELKHPILHIGGGCSKNVWKSIEKELVGEKSYYLFFKKNRTIIEYYFIKILTILYLLFKHPSIAMLKMKSWIIFLYKLYKK